jgi:aldose 1-epimerase
MKVVRAMLLCMMSVAVTHAAAVSRAPFGALPDGTKVEVYTLASPEMEVRVTPYGARIVAIRVKDRAGKMGDVVLGHNSVAEYAIAEGNPHFGGVPGRYANRIAKGRFTLDGKAYQLPINNGENTLHGGTVGFDRHVWTAKENANGVEMTLVSPDGDQGFPGTMTAHVRYTVAGSALRIDYSATTDKATVVNLTNHAYFNLSGEGNASVVDEVVTIDADRYTPVDAGLIPTGELAAVAGTPLDFTKPRRIGDRIDAENAQLKVAGGYDHTWVLRGKAGELREAARVFDPASGRVLTVKTTEPGVQFYTGNHLTGALTGKSGAKYPRRSGLCLETQHFPDSPNHPEFPSTVLRPGETFRSTTEFVFSVEK